jgi:hypothetical protein
MRTPEAPEKTYWILPGKLMAGAYPAHPKNKEHQEIITSLIGCGITDFINLVLDDETGMGGKSFRGYIIDYRDAASKEIKPVMHNFPIPDEEVPEEAYMIKILNKVDEILKLGRVPYIHCWGGKGRTGTVVGCWLVRNRYATREGVLFRLKELTAEQMEFFWHTPNTPEQEEYVTAWEPGK